MPARAAAPKGPPVVPWAGTRYRPVWQPGYGAWGQAANLISPEVAQYAGRQQPPAAPFTPSPQQLARPMSTAAPTATPSATPAATPSATPSAQGAGQWMNRPAKGAATPAATPTVTPTPTPTATPTTTSGEKPQATGHWMYRSGEPTPATIGQKEEPTAVTTGQEQAKPAITTTEKPATKGGAPAAPATRAAPQEPGIDVQSNGFSSGRAGYRPEWIILHSTDGKPENPADDLETLTRSGKVGAHYLVGRAGRSMHLVPEADSAWQAGKDKFGNVANPWTIGIEQTHWDGHEGWPDAQVKATAHTVAGILQRHPWIGLDHIIGHSELAPGRKVDPVDYPWDKFYTYLQDELGLAHSKVTKADYTGEKGTEGAAVRTAEVAGTESAHRQSPGIPQGRIGRDLLGSYGYPGDPTPDDNSKNGIGAFPWVSKPHSLIRGYSAGLTDAGAKMRGLRPGDEFVAGGRVFRYDDRAPAYAHGHKVPDEYVDVYNPDFNSGRGRSYIAGKEGLKKGPGLESERYTALSPGGGGGDGGGGGEIIQPTTPQIPEEAGVSPVAVPSMEEAERMGAAYPGSGGGGYAESPVITPTSYGYGGGAAATETGYPAVGGMPFISPQFYEQQAIYGMGGTGGMGMAMPGIEPQGPIPAAPGIGIMRMPAQLGGRAPAAPGVWFMPARRGIGGIQPESEEGEPIRSTLGEPNVPGFEQLTPLLGKLSTEATKKAQKLHKGFLSPDDTRVAKQADNFFKGEHFVENDPMHMAMLANTPPMEKVRLAAAQAAIATKTPMHVSYISAPPPAEKESPLTRAGREVNYAESSPQFRLLGQTNGRIAGHTFIPTAVGIALPRQKGQPNSGYIQGISTDVAAHNHYHLNKALAEMGQKSPYPELNSDKFHLDLAGYIQNLQAGHKGTGMGYQVGTKDYPARPNLKYVPAYLEQREADFLNAVINNQAARHSKGLQELARKGGTLLTEEGETNPLRHLIDVREAGLRGGAAEEIQDQAIKKAAENRWSNRVLEPTVRTFKAGLIHDIHESPHTIPEAIRPRIPGFEGMREVLAKELSTEKGRPDVPIAVHFMPAPLTPEEHQELTRNIRKQWISGRIRTPEYMERLRDVPAPGQSLGPMFMPAALKGRQQQQPVPTAGMNFKEVSPEEFITQRGKTTRPGYLSPLKAEELGQHRLFTNEEGTIGAAVDQKGDIQNVFNNGGPKGGAGHALIHAINQYGGRTLDAFDPFLPKLYRQFGFQETGRMRFNRDYAPSGWNFEQDDDPDVVFMAHHGYPEGGEEAALARARDKNPATWIKNERAARTETDFDRAKDFSRAIAGREAPSRTVGMGRGPEVESARGPSGIETGPGARRALGVGQPPAPGEEPNVPAPDSQNMRPLGYRAAVRLPNGMVYTGGTHEHAYQAAGQPHYDSGAEYGFTHLGTGKFVTYPEADQIMAAHYGKGAQASSEPVAEKLKLLGLPDNQVTRTIAARALRADQGKEAMLVSAVKDTRTGQIVTNERGHLLAMRELLGRTPKETVSGWTEMPGGLERELEGPKPDYVEYGYLTNTGRFVTSPMDLARQIEEGPSSIRPRAPGEPPPNVMFMAAGKGKAKLEKPKNWGQQPEEVRQAYLEKRVAQTLKNQYRGPETHKLVVQRNEQGGIKYDPQGNPIYEKHDYNIVNAPLLGKKGLNKIKNADEYEDTIAAEQHTHLNDVERRRLSAMRAVTAVDTMGDKIVDSFLGLTGIPEIMAGKGWYARMREKLARALGEHHHLFAHLLGATSAKTPVRNNFIQALDALEQFKSGAFDRHRELYRQAYQKLQEGGKDALVAHMLSLGIPLYELDEAGNRGGDVNDHKTDADAMANWIHHHGILPRQMLQPGQEIGSKYNANSLAVLRALAGTWLAETKAPKTPNFAGNLAGTSLEATIDVWAARHLHRLGYEGLTGKKPWRAQAQAEPGVSALDFAFSQDAMRNAADKLKAMGHDLNPDDLQAILWFAEKHHYANRGWTRGAGAAKSSFDEVADLAFPNTGEPMTSKDLREHYDKVRLAKERSLVYESHPKEYMRNRLEAFNKEHGIEQHHMEAARREKAAEEAGEPEEEEEAA
jgi:N-acetyl-anhydromuramyl-L-alanine amidase AmpD